MEYKHYVMLAFLIIGVLVVGIFVVPMFFPSEAPTPITKDMVKQSPSSLIVGEPISMKEVGIIPKGNRTVEQL